MIFHANSYGQCGCVWIDGSGNLQCVVASNCGGGQENACANQTTSSNYCDGSNPCLQFPLMTGNCPGSTVCKPNGACWYGSANCNFSATTCAIALPVTLINLIGSVENDYNEITWSTESENSNDYFEVERSQDGVSWSSVIKLPGAGNSQELLDYVLKDYDFDIAVNYYRIKQVDFDGRTSSYGPISLDNRFTPRKLLKTTNMLGQEVYDNFKGIVI
jgi:hypothetical protein